MVHKYVPDSEYMTPAYAGRLGLGQMPKHRLPDASSDAESIYRHIHDQLMLDGSSRLNLATFVTTWMEPQAEKLMAETFDKNMIDKDEYPQTAEIERRCVNIVADLFHAPGDGDAIGVSTIGSSEAVMLGGLAMKWRWRALREAAGKPTDKPNMVMGSNVQVVWEKFCRYWDVEARYVPITEDCFVVDPDDVMDRVDENTIGVIPILGTTYTGEFEPIKVIHDRVVAYNTEHGLDIPIHVDAASGGFVAPFIHPDLEWDFVLPQVKSINVSGHKYGLTYPGIGFVVWRSAADLPEDLIFHVNYLGGDMPTFTLNFSRPGNQIIGQYYNFLRLGRAGYTSIMETLRDVAMYLSSEIRDMGPFELLSDGSAIPVLAFKLKDSSKYTVFDVSERLRGGGWQVPAYTLPANATDTAIMRIVVREGLDRDLADSLLESIRDACNHFDEFPPSHSSSDSAFAH
jgi:glutamate decarboxylase